ncbi:methyltransferase [Ruegeria sp. HKCCD8929]|uniref:methyltransferase n=1 Tax=Ruegeria sp. HKCCD8929 TaxID=2683006 RepID=UPI00148820D2|nr:methyltransferase [Ruegeria sp. HKCCD8929]
MGRLETIRATATWKDIFQGQVLHVGLIVLLVSGALSLLVSDSSNRTFLSWNAQKWATCSILLAVVHQLLVAVVFRLELYKGLMTRMFGDRALTVWATVFLPLLIARPITIIIVGWLDQTPISGFRSAEVFLAIPAILVAVVTMHSVIKFFTIRRAIGADHFDNAIIAMPFVRQGMFKYTSNGMYGLVFLGLWGIALAFGSWNAFIVAFFQHVYIWVHMVLTEQPDIDRIYGSGETQA